MSSPDEEIDFRERWGRVVLECRIPHSTLWLRPWLDLGALGVFGAAALVLGFSPESARWFAALVLLWGISRFAVGLRPALAEWSLSPDGALFYRFARPDRTPCRFRADAIDLGELARSGALDTFGSALRHPVCWWISRWFLSAEAREEIRERADELRREAEESSRRETVEGNPSETVGATRILSARESEEALEVRAAPETIGEVVAEYFTGTHVLIAMCVLFGFQAVLAELLETLFVGFDASVALGGVVVATVVVFSALFFAVVRREDSDGASLSETSRRPATLTVGSEQFEIRRARLLGGCAGLRGDSWGLMEQLRLVERSRIGPSAAVSAVLRPLSSPGAFLVAACTDRDRMWLVRQVVPEEP